MANTTRKKRIKKIIIILIISAISFFIYYYFTEMRIEIGYTRGVRFLDDYSDYFDRTVLIRRTFIGTASIQVIHFRPGQRRLMLERIREDIKDSLKALIEEHGDVFYRYEISDDIRHVRIYETQGGPGRRVLINPDPDPGPISRIQSLLWLYHSVRLRDVVVGNGTGYTFDIILQMPSNVRFDNITSTSFRVLWDDMPGFPIYEISIDNGETWIEIHRRQIVEPWIDVEYTFLYLEPDTTYYVIIRARSGGGRVPVQAWVGEVRTLP